MEIINYLDTLETLALDEKTGTSMLRLTKDELFSLYFAATHLAEDRVFIANAKEKI